MTKDEQTIANLKKLKSVYNGSYGADIDRAIKALQVEPLTDTEQRIFLAAMSREEKVCKEVCKDGDGIDLVLVCHRIERKVKKAIVCMNG